MGCFRRSVSLLCLDGHPRRDGNSVDALTGAQSASELGSFAGARGGDGNGLGLGAIWTLDKCATFLSSDRNLFGPLYDASRDLFFPRILGSRSAAQQRNSARRY